MERKDTLSKCFCDLRLYVYTLKKQAGVLVDVEIFIKEPSLSHPFILPR